MNEDELLFALVNDKINTCNENYMITNTNFLDIYKQGSINNFLIKKRDVRYELYGGYSNAERRMIVFLPDYIESTEYFTENESDNPIVPLKIKKDSFSSLTHKDYLGALMGLGIKREMIGDIAVNNDGCFVAVAESIYKYIIDNLTSVGRGSVEVAKCNDFSGFIINENFDSKRCYVSSMRADSVIAAAFSISRGDAVDRINRGEVLINSYEITKPDAHVSFGSKIVIHGKGKVIINEDAGITKKGRHAFIIKKYC